MTAARRAPHVATASNGKSGRNAKTMIARLGSCVGADRKPRERPFVEQRLDEMLRLLRHRHGPVLPEIDEDRNDYFWAVAHTVHAWFDQHEDAKCWLLQWLASFAPWLPDPVDAVEKMLAGLHPRKRHLKATTLGRRWRLTLEERAALDIKTISPGDLSTAQFKKVRAAAKKERDRLRASERRREAKATPRSESLSATRPWEAHGVSRRTYERRLKAASNPVDANSSPPSKDPETGDDANSSPIVSLRITGDEFATEVAISTSTSLAPSPSNSRLATSAGRGKARPSRRRSASPSLVQLDLFPGSPS